jgi:hypothetical protein
MKMPLSAPGLGTEAQLHFGAADFEVIRKGTFVRCAVSGAVIPLNDLKYWSAELQEAYAGPEAVMQRVSGQKPR